MLMLLEGLHDLLGTIPDVSQKISLVVSLDILLFCLLHSLLEASNFKNTPELKIPYWCSRGSGRAGSTIVGMPGQGKPYQGFYCPASGI